MYGGLSKMTVFFIFKFVDSPIISPNQMSFSKKLDSSAF